MSGTEAKLVVVRGVREAERWLLEAVERALEDRDPRALAASVRVVVPSASLREHVSAALVRARGRALLGVRVQTLGGVAHELLERSGNSLRDAELLFPLVLRRELASVPELRALAALEGGDEAIRETVLDLLDAGLSPKNVSPLVRALGGTPRAQALCALALRVEARVGELGFAREGERFVRAAGELRARGPALLPARALFIHGFADATGAASELLDALSSMLPARVLCALPADPIQPERDDESAPWSARLRARFGSEGSPERAHARAEPAELRLLAARGAEGEVRAIAGEIRGALARGSEPERIGVVARDLAAYASVLRVAFARHGIPFSARKQRGPALPIARPVAALGRLLRVGGALDIDRWVDLLGESSSELRLAFHALGALELSDLARLDVDAILGGRSALPLPLIRGVHEPDGGAEEATASGMARAGLAHTRLESETGRALRALEALDAWPKRLAQALEALLHLAQDVLGWPEAVPAAGLLRAVAEEIAHGLPQDGEIARSELGSLVERRAADQALAPLGGQGGGVQVQDVMEARGQTFDLLFVLGMNRGLFPRAIREDPLLSDQARAAGRRVLPELPVKGDGHREERFLYTQLLGAAREVVLSWQRVDDEGREIARSPLLERQLGRGGLEASVKQPRADRRSAFETAVFAGVSADRDAFRGALALALEEAELCAGEAAQTRALARLRVLDEVEPPRAARGLGPYFGFVGATRARGDPRRSPLWVTHLEAIARCPWQAFLARTLRLSAPPDTLDLLPRLRGRTVGNVVHRALERIVRGALPPAADEPAPRAQVDALGAALARAPVSVAWPAPERLESLLLDSGLEAARGEGIALPGIERALAELARPYLLRARESLFAAGELCAQGVEVQGELSHGALRVRFKADLVEWTPEGARVWDYKTGAAMPRLASAEDWASAIERGNLQASAYARGQSAPGLRGGYVLLGSETVPAGRLALEPAGPELAARFEQTLETLHAARERGLFFPRLELTNEREPRACEWCDFASACLRGDSLARKRLRLHKSDLPGEAGRLVAALFALGSDA